MHGRNFERPVEISAVFQDLTSGGWNNPYPPFKSPNLLGYAHSYEKSHGTLKTCENTQMKISIIHTSENFNQINQAWPLLQPKTCSEVNI